MSDTTGSQAPKACSLLREITYFYRRGSVLFFSLFRTCIITRDTCRDEMKYSHRGHHLRIWTKFRASVSIFDFPPLPPIEVKIMIFSVTKAAISTGK